jgi:phage terminase large subunit-like protein
MGPRSNDTFASVITSAWGEGVAVRYVRPYVPTPGTPLDFDAIEADIRGLCARYAIQEIAYDPFLLGQLIRRLTSGPSAIAAPCVPFHQGSERLEADKGLYDLITSRRIAHDGNAELRAAHQRIATARSIRRGGGCASSKERIKLKIDLAVALSMGAARMAALVPRTLTEGANFLADWRG